MKKRENEKSNIIKDVLVSVAKFSADSASIMFSYEPKMPQSLRKHPSSKENV